jgi:hypothetical protein
VLGVVPATLLGGGVKKSIPIRAAWFAAAAATIATFLVMGAWSVRMALADYWFRQQSLLGMKNAIDLEADGADYYVRLAAMLREKNPVVSLHALQRAVTLNPWDSQSWVELGLRAEAIGDLAHAERSLLRGASVDKQYFPRWSLVNYYFRRGDSEKFGFWAREATRMAYGDLAPLFSLCWNVTSDSALIERELDIRKADTAASYLTYLIGENRVEPMTRAATRLLEWNREADVPIALAACDRLIVDDHACHATRIWNSLAKSRRIPFEVLAPGPGRSLTGGDFNVSPTSRGFDWRVPGFSGVKAVLDERPPGLRISFSGRQPESCDVLTQFLPILDNSNYELRFLYRTTEIETETGLAWRISDLNGLKTLAQGQSLASKNETEGKLSFSTPAGAGLVRLTLKYQRALGTTRIEGTIVLRKLRLELKVAHIPPVQ